MGSTPTGHRCGTGCCEGWLILLWSIEQLVKLRKTATVTGPTLTNTVWRSLWAPVFLLKARSINMESSIANIVKVISEWRWYMSINHLNECQLMVMAQGLCSIKVFQSFSSCMSWFIFLTASSLSDILLYTYLFHYKLFPSYSLPRGRLEGGLGFGLWMSWLTAAYPDQFLNISTHLLKDNGSMSDSPGY